MPSRRRFLAGTALDGAGLAGVGSVVPIGDVASSDPPADTWPQMRRDAANTASTDATLPSDPTVAWEAGAISNSFAATVLVDEDSVYVGGNGVAAFDRTSGGQRWSVRSTNDRLALHDGVVYAAAGCDTEGERTLRGFDAGTGAKQFETPLHDSHGHTTVAYGLVVTDDGLFVGGHGELLGFGLDGSHRWTVSPPGSGVVRPMVHEGTLYATHPGYVHRYDSRTLLDTVLKRGPDPVWRGGEVAVGPPTIVGDSLLIGNDQSQVDVRDPGVTAFDRTSGEQAWTAIEGPSGDGDRVQALTPARAGRERGRPVGVTAVSHGEGSDRTLTVVGLNLDDGSVRWRRESDRVATAVAGVTDGFVVGEWGENGDTLSGRIRVFGVDGEERWTVELGSPVLDVAPAEEELFAVLGEGRVVALR